MGRGLEIATYFQNTPKFFLIENMNYVSHQGIRVRQEDHVVVGR